MTRRAAGLRWSAGEIVRWGAVVGLAAVLIVQSPAVAGAPTKPRACPWLSPALPVQQRADMVLAAMTLTDKLSMLHGITTPGQSIGVQAGAPPYVGVVPGIPRLCLPALHLEDGPGGVGDGLRDVTQLPAPVAAAATWDRAAMRTYGAVIGAEGVAKGVNVVLAPTVNIVRDPRWGRAFESLGEDPYLTSEMAIADIDGIQSQGPMAQVKHLAAYNEETLRDTALNNAIVSPRVLQEVYLRAFGAAVQQGHVASVMCAYNELNGVRDCENPYLMDNVVKGEFGFTGFVTSDWFALTSSAGAANAGLDMQMPDSCLFGTQLGSDVATGTISVGRIDDMVRRILREMFAFGLFNRASTGTTSSKAATSDHALTARSIAAEGTVLLKNDGVLPLSAATRSIAVIGADAGSAAQATGGGSARVVAPYLVTPYDGIVRRAPHGTKVSYDDATNLAAATRDAAAADVAVVFVSNWNEEDRDQLTVALPADQNALVAAIAAANPHTIVVLNTGSAVLVPWSSRVSGMLEAWYPGQEDGNAIAAVLFGDVNPSGRLPVTFPASPAQMPTATPDRWPGIAGQVQYSEGLLVGYRWYDATGGVPQFPFGFGLSYTTFRIDQLQLSSQRSADGNVSVTARVTNTGKREGSDVVQLYLTDPAAAGEPVRQLAGFQRVDLAPGESRRVTFGLDTRALSYWDPAVRRWHAVPGRYVVAIGESSRDLPLTGSFVLSHPILSGPTVAPASTTVAAPSAGDVTTCWQDQLGPYVNAGLSVTGESQPSNLSQVPDS